MTYNSMIEAAEGLLFSYSFALDGRNNANRRGCDPRYQSIAEIGDRR